MGSVKLRGIKKNYGPIDVIKGVDLGIEDGSFCVFVGPSGCGKSTLLRMIAGLEVTSQGQIDIASRDVTSLDPAERGVAMVFQSYALYPHMTVRENMGFGLKMNKTPKAEIAAKVAEAAGILKLEDYLDRKPKALSGGQRQRVAIGRALVRDPEVFLFDEPLSNLDAELRVEMRVELARLHRELGTTMIYVTHDQVEAMTLADEIVVLRDGKIMQNGAPLTLYDDPDNKFVAGFLGAPSMNFAEGEIVKGGIRAPAFSPSVIEVKLGSQEIGRKLWVGIRPENITLTDENFAKIELVEELGGITYVHAQSNGSKIVASLPGKSRVEIGAERGFSFDASDIRLFDYDTELRIRSS